MAAIVASQSIPYETRINLAVQAIQASQVPSIRAAATLYDVSRATLQLRLLGRGARRAAQANNRKLTATEEQALLDRIISLDERGFSPTLPFVRRMADLLLSQRVPGSSVGKNWLTRFVQRHDALVSKYLRKYDYQWAKCEDPEEINKWFSLVRETISKYGIAAEDIYNFDETGFQMGVIATAKVITQTKQPTKDNPKSVRTNSGRPKVIQPGNRTWVTVIEGVNATGWALPSTIIFEGKVHQSNWYQTGIPPNWVIGVSENGWTNNDLGFKWLTEVFDKHSRGRLVGRYRLLLLDGHGSHLTPEFDDFCKSSIIWLCYPPQLTHLLQPLDFGCFSALKGSYGRLVQDKVGLGTFHIDKTDFLNLYCQAHKMKFTEDNKECIRGCWNCPI